MKFKIGSKVRCIIANGPYLKVGQTYTIAGFESSLAGGLLLLVGHGRVYSCERFINPIIETKLGKILYK